MLFYLGNVYIFAAQTIILSIYANGERNINQET